MISSRSLRSQTEPSFLPGKLIRSLIILAVLSVIGGFIELPESFGNVHLFSSLVDHTLPALEIQNKGAGEILFTVVSAVITLFGIYLAYIVYLKKPALGESFKHSKLHVFFEKGWGFDNLYDTLFVRPVVWLSVTDKNDFLDYLNISLSRLALAANRVLSHVQNGKLRWYLMSFAIGIVLILTYMLNQ